MLGPGDSLVLNKLPLWELVKVLLERRSVDFGGNDDDNLKVEEALQALIVKVEEVVEAENSATDNISAETVDALDLPLLSSTTPGLNRRGID